MDKKTLRAHIRAFNKEQDSKKKAKMAQQLARENAGKLSATWEKSLDKRFDWLVKRVEKEN